MCSRTVSDTANMSRHWSTLCSPTEGKILCRSLFRSGHMSAICARLSKGKGRFTRGWKPQVSTLLCARAASAHSPAEVQRKTFRPLGANTLTQFVYPAQPVQKRSRPLGANPLTPFVSPAQPVLKKSCRPSGANTPAAVRVPQLVGAENIYKKSCCTHAAALFHAKS